MVIFGGKKGVKEGVDSKRLLKDQKLVGKIKHALSCSDWLSLTQHQWDWTIIWQTSNASVHNLRLVSGCPLSTLKKSGALISNKQEIGRRDQATTLTACNLSSFWFVTAGGGQINLIDVYLALRRYARIPGRGEDTEPNMWSIWSSWCNPPYLSSSFWSLHSYDWKVK